MAVFIEGDELSAAQLAQVRTDALNRLTDPDLEVAARAAAQVTFCDRGDRKGRAFVAAIWSATFGLVATTPTQTISARARQPRETGGAVVELAR